MSPAVSLSSGSYRGRFAPSPSGPLHFGSLIAALASYLDAKSNKGSWLLRIEDIDTPRVVKGADTQILKALEAYGLEWDEHTVYQSHRLDLYQDVLSSLENRSLVYGCQCTRKLIKQKGGIYDNHCRSADIPFDGNAIRLEQHFPIHHFSDRIQGHVSIPHSLASEDYIIKRRDSLFAYQLVVVIDDIEQGINNVVRGADLLEPTARQLGLFKQLDANAPSYAHVPLAVASPGFKLSKQNHAPAIDINNPVPALITALMFLGFEQSTSWQEGSVDDILKRAIKEFSLSKIPATQEIQVIKDDNHRYRFTTI